MLGLGYVKVKPRTTPPIYDLSQLLPSFHSAVIS